MHVDYHYWGDLCTDSSMSMKSGFLIASILPKSLSCVGWISSRKRWIQALLHAGSLLGQGWRGVLVYPRKVSYETRSRERTSLSKDLKTNKKTKKQASLNSSTILGLQGSLEAERHSRRGEGYQRGPAGVMLHPARGWQHLPHALGASLLTIPGRSYGTAFPCSPRLFCTFFCYLKVG